MEYGCDLNGWPRNFSNTFDKEDLDKKALGYLMSPTTKMHSLTDKVRFYLNKTVLKGGIEYFNILIEESYEKVKSIMGIKDNNSKSLCEALMVVREYTELELIKTHSIKSVLVSEKQRL